MDPVVAEIVADTMDGYMMFRKTLKCRVLEPKEVHKDMFRGQYLRYKSPRKNKIDFMNRHNSVCENICILIILA